MSKKKISIKISNAWVIFFRAQVLLVIAPSLSAHNPAQSEGEPEYITESLLNIESKRLSDTKTFSAELRLLEKDKPLMSSYQSCHYQFLKNYETAFHGGYDHAQQSLEQQLTECEDLRARIRINAMLANIYVISGQFEKSIQNMDAVIENASQTNDKTSKILAYSVASVVYNLLQQTDLSKEFSQLLYQTDPNASNLCQADYYKHRSSLINEDEGISEQAIKTTFQECITTDNSLMAYMLLLNLYKQQLQTQAANLTTVQAIYHELNNIESAIDETGYRNIQALYYALKSLTAYHLSEFDKAEQLANQALILNKPLGDSEQYIIALTVLEQVSLITGKFKQSYEYLKLKSNTEKKMFNINQSKLISFMTVKHSNLAKTFEIEQLNQKNTLLELEKQLSDEKTSNQRLVIILVLSLFGTLAFWALRLKRKHDYFKDVSEIDHLTKVYTRKAFEEQIQLLLTQAKTRQQPVHMAIMDLDHFKKVNDNHGHLTGDWVLKNVIYTCKELIKENMMIARLGGEEFCIAYVGVDADVMNDQLEAMRNAIEKLDCSASGVNDLHVTASFGVSSNLTSGYSLTLLLTHADVALFEAKNKGRNQVMVFNDSHD